MLRYLKETQKLGWKEIASHFPNRTTNACQFRWRRLVSGTLRTPSSSSSSSPSYQQQPTLVIPQSTSSSSSSSSTSTSTTSNYPLPPHQLPPTNHPTSLPHQIPPLISQYPPTSQHRQLRHQVSTPIFANNYSQPDDRYIPQYSRPWTKDEDELILSRTDLGLDELLLLFVGRNEIEISNRRNELLRYPSIHQQQQQHSQHHSHSHRHQQPSNTKLHHRASVSALPPLRERTSMNQLPSISSLSKHSTSPFNNNILPPPKGLKKSKSTFDGLRLPPPQASLSTLSPGSGHSASNMYPPPSQFNTLSSSSTAMNSQYGQYHYPNYGSSYYR